MFRVRCRCWRTRAIWTCVSSTWRPSSSTPVVKSRRPRRRRPTSAAANFSSSSSRRAISPPSARTASLILSANGQYIKKCNGNYSATSIWSWYTGRWWVGCYLWYIDEGTETWRFHSPPRPLLAVPNLTAHPSTASVPITVLLYDGLLLCGFNTPIKGLSEDRSRSASYHRSHRRLNITSRDPW